MYLLCVLLKQWPEGERACGRPGLELLVSWKSSEALVSFDTTADVGLALLQGHRDQETWQSCGN